MTPGKHTEDAGVWFHHFYNKQKQAATKMSGCAVCFLPTGFLSLLGNVFNKTSLAQVPEHFPRHPRKPPNPSGNGGPGHPFLAPSLPFQRPARTRSVGGDTSCSSAEPPGAMLQAALGREPGKLPSPHRWAPFNWTWDWNCSVSYSHWWQQHCKLTLAAQQTLYLGCATACAVLHLLLFLLS